MATKWVQKIFPFLDDSKLVVYSGGKPLYDWYGWCLAVVDASFGVAPFAASAIKAWEVNKTKYTEGGMSIPIGMYVPVFYRGGQYGHIVIAYRDAYDHIKVWSSPYTHKPYFDRFEGPVISTLDRVGRIYGCSYIGWSPTLGDKTIASWEMVAEPIPQVEPPKEPAPTPEEKKPATEESSAEPAQVNLNKNDDAIVVPDGDTKAEVSPTIADDGVEKVTKEQFEKLMKENTAYMEKFGEIIAEAGNGITFKPLTKKIVYIVCDLLLLAGAEVNPVMTLLNASSVEMFATALTQALFTAGVGGLLIFKLLKAKGEKSSGGAIDKN